MVRRGAQGQGPDRCADAVEQQVAPGWVAGQTYGHGHDRAQAVDEAKTQDPDVRMAADVVKCPVAHGLPAWFAREDGPAVTAAHEVPQLVAGIAAEERCEHHQIDVHVSAERKEARKNQDGLAFKKRAEKKGKVAEILQELLKHFLGC
ncbi:hypothetical protein KNHN1_51350 [Pseudomonas guariconensis]